MFTYNTIPICHPFVFKLFSSLSQVGLKDLSRWMPLWSMMDTLVQRSRWPLTQKRRRKIKWYETESVFHCQDLKAKGCHVLGISLSLFQCAVELQSVRIEEEIQCSEETEDPEKWELSVNVCVLPSVYYKYSRFHA